MMLHALVRDRQTREMTTIDADNYSSKEAFWRELEANGYIVKRISTDLDLKAMDKGFTTWSSLVKYDKEHHTTFGWWSEHHAYILLKGEVKK